MTADLIERLERLGNELLTLVNDLKADAAISAAIAEKRVMSSDGDEWRERDYKKAVEVLRTMRTVSTTRLQRECGWGYNHAAFIIDMLEQRKLISPASDTGSREIYVDRLPGPWDAK